VHVSGGSEGDACALEVSGGKRVELIGDQADSRVGKLAEELGTLPARQGHPAHIEAKGGHLEGQGQGQVRVWCQDSGQG
tara:strand:- start:215 stop:451 length:237 start_codon:yes stop_codon:yes gene_type:complete